MTSGDYQDRFESFYRDHMPDALDRIVDEYEDGRRSLRIDWELLSDVDPSLADDFLERPDTVRQKAHAALLSAASGLQREIDRAGTHSRANVRIRGLPEQQKRLVGKCRTDDLGSLVSVDGMVAGTERVSPLAEMAAWECQRCGEYVDQRQYYGKMVEPHKCPGCEAQGPWVMDEAESDLVDHQEIVLFPPDPQRDDPPGLLTFLDDDITDSVGKGDVVTVVGVYDTLPSQNETVLETYLEAFDLDVEEYAEAGADGRELQAEIVDFVTEHQEVGSSWGVEYDRVVEHFEAESIRRREIESTINEAKEEKALHETNGKLVVIED